MQCMLYIINTCIFWFFRTIEQEKPEISGTLIYLYIHVCMLWILHHTTLCPQSLNGIFCCCWFINDLILYQRVQSRVKLFLLLFAWKITQLYKYIYTVHIHTFLGISWFFCVYDIINVIDFCLLCLIIGLDKLLTGSIQHPGFSYAEEVTSRFLVFIFKHCFRQNERHLILRIV